MFVSASINHCPKNKLSDINPTKYSNIPRGSNPNMMLELYTNLLGLDISPSISVHGRAWIVNCPMLFVTATSTVAIQTDIYGLFGLSAEDTAVIAELPDMYVFH